MSRSRLLDDSHIIDAIPTCAACRGDMGIALDDPEATTCMTCQQDAWRDETTTRLKIQPERTLEDDEIEEYLIDALAEYLGETVDPWPFLPRDAGDVALAALERIIELQEENSILRERINRACRELAQ